MKSLEQQSVMVLHRVRQMLMRQRVQLSNAIRGHMAEFGLAAPVGREGLGSLVRLIGDDDERVSEHSSCAHHGPETPFRNLRLDEGHPERTSFGVDLFNQNFAESLWKGSMTTSWTSTAR